MYRAVDFLHYVYPLVGQIGGTIAITDKHFLLAINWAMNQMRVYGGYKRSRQRHKDAWNLINNEDGIIRIKTSHPILQVGNFYCGNMKPVEVESCGCEPSVIEDSHNCPCQCYCDNGTDLNLVEKQPMDEIRSGQYAIVRNSGVHKPMLLGCKCPDSPTSICGVGGVGGPGGNLVHMKLPGGCGCKNSCNEGIRMTYRRAPQHIFDINSPILIPDLFIVPLAYYVAAYLMPAFGQGRAGDDINYTQLARQEINELVKQYTIVPNKIEASSEGTFNPESKKPAYSYSH